ncbi:MAG: alanine--tRNA ligase [Ignavibacteria bacterium]|nr:alanine--tRNA ligase [Ignavibacteria bacterium]
MTSAEIRNSFLDFFKQRGHAIVPSSPVVPFDDPTLLFSNAGMNQFKDVFLGAGKRSYTRAADTQKCIRVSGKHNDLEEVGRDTYHHTFFEMLGNWSFGDYYKKEAIEWAWELLTKVWGLPKKRLWATVYKDDDEAERLWKTVTDIDHGHVLRFGEKDNFWEMGETGPCGPCSEIHIDRTTAGNADASLVNAGTADLMEIWNLVFIQYNRDADGKLTPLPANHVDTGMGFERMCAVLQNKDSNYDTDVFTPLIHHLSKISGKSYDGRTTSVDMRQLDTDTAIRVIADHIRALTFAIADGAVPSNEGRGYVLRRLLRRASRFGRKLDLHEPFISTLVPVLVETMGSAFPEIRLKHEHIQKVIRGEEESFSAALDRGLERFEQVVQQIGHSKTFPGEDAFRLYDTYGFPLDLTELMAAERGLKVDVGLFTELMEQQRERSRSLGIVAGTTTESSEVPYVEILRTRESARSLDTAELENRFQFVGYDRLESQGLVLSSRENLVVLDTTPFYGEAGGQVGDQGYLRLEDKRTKVLDTQKSGNVNVHVLESPGDLRAGQIVQAEVDARRRYAIMQNHTATHLVHAALRQILGTHVHQAGSLVAPEYLRFDFAHFAKVSEQELAAIEGLVNEKISDNIMLTHYRNIPFDEAKKMGALMFFGDKYGDRVNVVEFGQFSREFCGGTHVRSTAELGYFKFRSEGSVASGIRRIEAVTSDRALERLRLQDRNASERIDYAEQQLQQAIDLHRQMAELGTPVAARVVASLSGLQKKLEALRATPGSPEKVSPDLSVQFRQRAERGLEIESLVLEIGEEKRKLEKDLSRQRLQSLSGFIETLIQKATLVDGLKVVAAKIQVGSLDELKTAGDTLRSRLGSGVGVLASVLEDKVSFVCVVTDDLVASRRVEAGRVVGAVAKLVGGGGGGKAHLATAGGKDIGKLDDALRATESIVRSLLKN